MKRFLEIGGVVAGVLLIAFGAAAIYKAIDGRNTVSHELGQQKITGASFMTPDQEKARAVAAGLDMAVTPIPTCSVANLPINNGERARCFSQYMQVDTLMATHGFYYSEMGQYEALPDTPKSDLMPGGGTNNPMYAVLDKDGRTTSNGARQIWVTETGLATALISSYMAEQMANFGIVVGIALLLSGVGFVILALGGALENESWIFKQRAAKKAAAPEPLEA